MVIKPGTTDEAIQYVWALPETVLKTSEKQRLVVVMADVTDAVARRYFSSKHPELWVYALEQLLEPPGILPFNMVFAPSAHLCMRLPTSLHSSYTFLASNPT